MREKAAFHRNPADQAGFDKVSRFQGFIELLAPRG